MAKWPDTPVYTPITNINKGNEYQEADGLIAADINAITENIAYIYNLIDTNASEYTVAERYADGRLAVGYPIADADAVHKKYAEDNFIQIIQISSGPFQIPQIGYDKEVNWIDCNVSISPLSLAQRSSDGIVYVNPPDTVPENVSDYAAVNVGYANKTYVKAINVTENTYVYAASSEGPNGRLRVSTVGDSGTVAQRDTNGAIKVGTPVDNADAVNLQYFTANALTANNVKTLFGNQSIAGSGNIDLFNHDIKITGTDPSINATYEVHVFKTSSKNLKVDSLTDLKTLLGNTFKYWNVNGSMQNTLGSQGWMSLYVTENSIVFQPTTVSTPYTVSLAGATFTDDVTTV